MNRELYYCYMPKNYNFICYLCNNKVYINIDIDIRIAHIDAECKNPICFNCENIVKKLNMI